MNFQGVHYNTNPRRFIKRDITQFVRDYLVNTNRRMTRRRRFPCVKVVEIRLRGTEDRRSRDLVQ